MDIAIDIGNSNVVIGIWNQDQWRHVWRIPTVSDDDLNAYKLELVRLWVEAALDVEEVRSLIISSVVPDLNRGFEAFTEDLFGLRPLMLDAHLIEKIELEVERPHEIGSDLVANAYAAVSQCCSDCLIVDFGTALTFTSVSKDRKLLGVTIAPGVGTALSALRTHTARLPEVPMEYPESVVGKDTVHAIQSGVIIGYEGMIKHMIDRHKSELGPDLTVVATGGLSKPLSPYHYLFDKVNPFLTLDGLRYIARDRSTSRTTTMPEQ